MPTTMAATLTQRIRRILSRKDPPDYYRRGEQPGGLPPRRLRGTAKATAELLIFRVGALPGVPAVRVRGVMMRGVELANGDIYGEIMNVTVNGVGIGPLVN